MLDMEKKVKQRKRTSCVDRINMIDRIGDDENPDNPVNHVEKDLHVSTRSTRPGFLRLCVLRSAHNAART